MKRTLYRSFWLRCSLLFCFNLLLVIFNQLGLGALNVEEECALLNSDHLLVSMLFTAADLILTFLEFLDAFGIVTFVFFCLLVDQKLWKNLGPGAVLLSSVIASLSSYLILYIPDSELGLFGLVSSLKSALLFSVLPAVTAICIKYVLWKLQEKCQDRDSAGG